MPWLRMLKDEKNKVYVEVGPDGTCPPEDAPCPYRYRLEDTREYTARPFSLSPIPGETPLDIPVPPSPKKRKAAPNAPQPDASETAIPTATHLNGRIIEAYTDGGCDPNPGPAGLGVVLLAGPHRLDIWEYLGQATNNIAELTAILRALEAVKKPDLPLRIYTDSAYAIGVLNGHMKAKANQELIGHIRNKMAGFPHLELVKVKAHAGILYNEAADQLATRALTTQSSGQRRHPPSPKKEAPAIP